MWLKNRPKVGRKEVGVARAELEPVHELKTSTRN